MARSVYSHKQDEVVDAHVSDHHGSCGVPDVAWEGWPATCRESSPGLICAGTVADVQDGEAECFA